MRASCGPNLMYRTGARGWRDSDAQRRMVPDGWTLTDDICTRHPDGWFQHIRRADALIVSAGYKISIRKVEDTLKAHRRCRNRGSLRPRSPFPGAVAKTVIVPATRAGAATLAERLQHYLKEELAPFKCPREIRIV